MKITEKLAKAEREGRTFWSFEFFPPRTAQVDEALGTLPAWLSCRGCRISMIELNECETWGPSSLTSLGTFELD